MTYAIQPYTRNQADKLGLQIRSSSKTHKKLDILRQGKLIASVGDDRYKDFPTYRKLEQEGEIAKGTADKRRQAYHARHVGYAEKRNGEYTPGFLAGRLLW